MIIILQIKNNNQHTNIQNDIKSSNFISQTKTITRKKKLRISLSYLLHEPVKEYLYESNIYRGKKNRSKYDLIDMIISEKNKTKPISPEDDDFTLEEATKLLNNNRFAKLPGIKS